MLPLPVTLSTVVGVTLSASVRRLRFVLKFGSLVARHVAQEECASDDARRPVVLLSFREMARRSTAAPSEQRSAGVSRGCPLAFRYRAYRWAIATSTQTVDGLYIASVTGGRVALGKGGRPVGVGEPFPLPPTIQC